MSDNVQEQLGQLQLLEQNLQHLAAQKQQIQSQLFEVENALKELKESKQAYKIIGNIMVNANPQTLQKELSEKQELLALRVSTLEKQEKSLQEKAKDLQEEVVKGMKK